MTVDDSNATQPPNEDYGFRDMQAELRAHQEKRERDFEESLESRPLVHGRTWHARQWETTHNPGMGWCGASSRLADVEAAADGLVGVFAVLRVAHVDGCKCDQCIYGEQSVRVTPAVRDQLEVAAAALADRISDGLSRLREHLSERRRAA